MAEFYSPTVTLNIQEFDEPTKMDKAFCPQLSEEEYEEQTSTETQKALKELMAYIEEDPDVYLNVIQKRKKDKLEEAGMVSYLKVKVMSMLNGGVYPGSEMSAQEKKGKVAQLKSGMQKAFDYSQEAKGHRFSKRLAEKRLARNQQDENCPVPVAHVIPRNSHESVPPPPPPPPLPCPGNATPSRPPLLNLARPPLRDSNAEISSPCPSSVKRPKSHVTRALGSSISCGSTTSLTSITSELNSSNPMKRLRNTGLHKSPGGTPVRRRRHARRGSATSMASLPYEEPLHMAFMNILEQKFKNVRSPSPVGRFYNGLSPSSANSFSHGEFTP